MADTVRNITLLGDTHGDMRTVNELIKYSSNDGIFQLGDICLRGDFFWEKFSKDFHFIRGNHDDPELCSQHSCYLGDFGFIEDLDLFFISGAKSLVDSFEESQIGITCWLNEELSEEELEICLNYYLEKKPKVVISHDCPDLINKKIHRFEDSLSRTRIYMQKMLDIHRPEFWFFGHHHRNMIINDKGTVFTCLGLNQHIHFSY